MRCGSRGEGIVAVVGRRYALPRATVRLKVGLTTVEIRLAPPKAQR